MFTFAIALLPGTKHLVAGGKKNCSYIADLFDPWVKKLDPTSTRVDCVFFDGAANVQKAGRILEARYPRIHVQTCAAHSVSLFFSDICQKIWQVKLMLVNYRRLYRLFGSGAMHSPYALFVAQSKVFNGGRKVGLIKAAGTRMAGHAYAQVRMLRLRDPLVATISSAAYKALKLKGFPKKVEEYLLNPDMWEATYILQRCLFPMIRCLRLGDKSSCGGMSKILFYVHKTDEAIEKSLDLLKDLKYFEEYDEDDAEDMEGIDLEDGFDGGESDDDEAVQPLDNEDNDEDDDEDEDELEETVENTHLGEKILSFWNHRRTKLITPLAIAGWYCSPSDDVRKDVMKLDNGIDRLEVDRCIKKMYHPIQDQELGVICNTFWTEFNQFQTKTGPGYSRSHIWDSDEIKHGNDHLWHKLYSIPFTKVFGLVACRVCSKPLGCGNAERNWGTFKHLKTGKRSHLSGDKAQKQATVFGAASMEKARAIQAAEEANGMVVESRWSDADICFELGLENWNLAGAIAIPKVVVPKRIFYAYMEDWEFELIHNKDVLAKERLLQKYGGLRWRDKDNDDDMVIAVNDDMTFQAGRKSAGWCVLGLNDDGTTEPWTIDCVIDEIAECEQTEEMNVEVIIDEVKRAANKVRMNEGVVEEQNNTRRKSSNRR